MIDTDTLLLVQEYDKITILHESYKEFKRRVVGDYTPSELASYIDKFKQLKSKSIISNDITTLYDINFDEFKQYIDDAAKSKTPTQLKKSAEWNLDDLHDDVELIDDTDQFSVLKINSFEASRKYGSNTNWCIVASESHWEIYTNTEDDDAEPYDVYFVLHKNYPKYIRPKYDNSAGETSAPKNVYKKIAIVNSSEGWTVHDSSNEIMDATGVVEFYIQGDPYLIETNKDFSVVLYSLGILDVAYDDLDGEGAYRLLSNGIGDIEKLETILGESSKSKLITQYITSRKYEPFKRMQKIILRKPPNNLPQLLNFYRLLNEPPPVEVIAKKINELFSMSNAAHVRTTYMNSIINLSIKYGSRFINVDKTLIPIITSDEKLTSWYMYNQPYRDDVREAFDKTSNMADYGTFYMTNPEHIRKGDNSAIDKLTQFVFDEDKSWGITRLVELLNVPLSKKYQNMLIAKASHDDHWAEGLRIYKKKFKF